MREEGGAKVGEFMGGVELRGGGEVVRRFAGY